MTPGKGVYIHDLWGISGTFTEASKRPADDAATASRGKRAKVSAGGQTCLSRLRCRKCGNVVKTGINHPMFDGIYHPFIYCVLGYGYCFNHINVYMYIIIYIYMRTHNEFWFWWFLLCDGDEWWWVVMSDVEWWWVMVLVMVSDGDDEWWLHGDLMGLDYPDQSLWIQPKPSEELFGVWFKFMGLSTVSEGTGNGDIMVIRMGENANSMGIEQRLCGDLTNATWPLTLLSQCLNGWLLLTTVDLQKDHR